MSVTTYGNPAHLLPPSWKSIITSWLAEDTPSFDCGGFVVGEEPQIAHLLGKQSVHRSSCLSRKQFLIMLAGCAGWGSVF